MTPCFADTFFFLALLNPGDEYHARAVTANRVDRAIVTSDWVLLELADHLCDVRNRSLVKAVRVAVTTDRRFRVVDAEKRDLVRATDLYDQRSDKDWSLTDCTSFVLMRDSNIAEALTADHHFEQAGFTLLLK